MTPGPFDLPITEPGVYEIGDAAYFADPVPGGSLSSTGARALLPPSCPAKFHHQRTHPRATTKAFDFGHAAHRMLLGAGAPLRVVDADDWRTKAAREARDTAHRDGETPILRHEYDRVVAMAQAINDHPFAGKLFAPGTGKPEQTLVWRDDDTGVMCRAKVDWLPDPGAPVRYILPDYKSAVSVEPEQLRRACYQHGYHIQAPFYLRGIRALGIDAAPAFVFVAQEKEPPHLVTVFQPDLEAMAAGDAQVSKALRTYAECTARDEWPAYADNDVVQLPLPAYAIREDF